MKVQPTFEKTATCSHNSALNGSPNSTALIVVSEEDITGAPIALVRESKSPNLREVALTMRLRAKEKKMQCATTLKDTSRMIREIDSTINHIFGQQGKLQSEIDTLRGENKILKEENMSLKREIDQLGQRDIKMSEFARSF